MGAVNYWGDPCPICKEPITDRDSQFAVLCAKCIADAMETVLARDATARAKPAHGADGGKEGGR